jgi:hypothetical protein
MAPESRHLKAVRAVLRGYAERGVFNGFREERVRAGVTRFEFGWLYRRRYSIELNEQTATLTVRDCFPQVPAGSQLSGGIKDFLMSRRDPSLLPHRRIDASRVEIGSVNRKGSVSLTVKVKRNQFTHATRVAVNLLHETFLMIDQCFTEYLHEHFGLPEE